MIRNPTYEATVHRLAAFSWAIVVATAAATPAFAADDTAANVAACAAIVSDLNRLDCFDQLATSLSKPPPAVKAPDAPPASAKWTFDQSRSPIDDSPQVVATKVVPDGTLNSWALIVECRDHKTTLSVSTVQYLGLPEDHVHAVYRIGDLPPVEQIWTGNGGTTAVYPGDAIKFIRSVPDSGKFFVRLLGYNGLPHDATFTLDGLQEVRNRVGTACKWPAH